MKHGIRVYIFVREDRDKCWQEIHQKHCQRSHPYQLRMELQIPIAESKQGHYENLKLEIALDFVFKPISKIRHHSQH